MSSLRRLGRAAALTAVVVLATACEAPPARAEQPPVTETRRRTLGQWTGTGSRQTESFDVATGALRLGRDARADGTSTGSGARRFRVWLHSAISGRPLQLIVDTAGAGTGAVYVADDPRVSYLVVEAEGATWTATLDEALGPARR